MSWLQSQWRGRQSAEAVLWSVFVILGLPFAASAAFLFYASIFDAALMPAAEFALQNLVVTLRGLPGPLLFFMNFSGALLVVMPMVIPFIAVIIGVHQLIATMRSGGSGPTNGLRRISAALRRAIARITSPDQSQRTVSASA